jgi:hypothetical protein
MRGWALAVRQLGLHHDHHPVARAHVAHALFETADHAVHARAVLVRPAFRARVPELAAVRVAADAMDHHDVARARLRAGAALQEDVAEPGLGRDGVAHRRGRPVLGHRRQREHAKQEGRAGSGFHWQHPDRDEAYGVARPVRAAHGYIKAHPAGRGSGRERRWQAVVERVQTRIGGVPAHPAPLGQLQPRPEAAPGRR